MVVNIEDFTNVFQQSVQFYNNGSKPVGENQADKPLWNDNEECAKIQKQYGLVLQQKQDLEKYNLNLQDQATKYALMRREEKDEKNEVLNKFETLQNQYNNKLESFSFERLKRARKYHLLFGITIFLLATLLRLIFPGFVSLLPK